MGVYIYKVSYETIPTGVSIGDKEYDFLLDFMSDYHETYFYLDEEMLDETLEGYKEQGKEPPMELVNFLREQIKQNEGDFSFVVA